MNEPITTQTPAQDAGNGTPAAPQPGAQPTPPAAPAPANPGEGTGQQPGVPATPDYQEKFSQSTRENQRIMEILRNNGIDPNTGQRVQQQGAQPQPGVPTAQPPQPGFTGSPEHFTDDQLAQAIPGFNALTAAEKDVIRYAKTTAQTVAQLQRQVAELYDDRTTTQQIEQIKTQDQFKVIAENEKAFREYAYRPENLSLNIEHVAFKFMQELRAGTIQPATPQGAAPTPVAQPGMEGGAGGQKQVNTPGGEPGVREMTAGEAAELRRTNHREYNKLAKEGKLRIVSR